MLTFQQPKDDYAHVYLEDTDKPLPKVLNPNTRYMFLGTVAKGGKSIIRSCRDLHLSRIVVHKSLRTEFKDDEFEVQRLLREARVTAQLQHPNMVPTYEIGRDREGGYYFTMKLVHGYTLREIMDYRERYDLTQLVHVIEQIGHALAYAHAHGVAHRDIKPENILAGPYGEVLLLDWGLAKVWAKDGSSSAEQRASNTRVVVTDKTMTGYQNLQGTLCYMSPEQIERDAAISFSTDVYSLGAVLYELLSGVLPFDAEHAYEILDAVKTKQPERPSEVSKFHVPKALDRLTMRCLEKDPAQRPTMEEFIQILKSDWMRDL